jgi:hypothetical protein
VCKNVNWLYIRIILFLWISQTPGLMWAGLIRPSNSTPLSTFCPLIPNALWKEMSLERTVRENWHLNNLHLCNIVFLSWNESIQPLTFSINRNYTLTWLFSGQWWICIAPSKPSLSFFYKWQHMLHSYWFGLGVKSMTLEHSQSKWYTQDLAAWPHYHSVLINWAAKSLKHWCLQKSC